MDNPHMGLKGVKLRFYGVRGSLPVPGSGTVRVGGNTSCVLYTVGDEMIVLDCGSGMRVLSNDLLAEGRPVRASVLLSHYHWDHLLGLPFFVPIYQPGTELTFYGERKSGLGPKEEIEKQFTGPNFPVERKDLSSRLSFVDVKAEDSFEIGEVKVDVLLVNHPNSCVGYRLDCRGTRVVYATDHEHGTDLDDGIIEMARGADCLIYDSMYTQQEYRSRAQGWGHSTWEQGVRIATAAEVKNLFLFHHEPDRDDEAVDAIEAEATRSFRGAIAAREGFEYSF
jgi:phosphoribosyl 1,2-cyclic phosphodiesterase